MRQLLFLFLTFFLSCPLWAQELNCTVSVTHTKVNGVDPKLYQKLQQDLNQFLNNRKWTDDHYQNFEKITCSFLLNITKKEKDANVFDAILTIQASRPVYNTDYNSPIVHFQDKEVTFRYDESQTLTFNKNDISGSDPLAANLTAVFAYYVYYILGLNYDSFSPNGGSPYFHEAQNIVDRAPSQEKSISGWKSSGSDHNRYWLIEETLNPKFKAFRTFWYAYHRKGLDLLATKPKEALKTIFSGIPILKTIHDENTDPVLLQFYFDAKSTEWASLIQMAPKEQRSKYAKEMMNIDITNAKKYRKIK